MLYILHSIFTKITSLHNIFAKTVITISLRRLPHLSTPWILEKINFIISLQVSFDRKRDIKKKKHKKRNLNIVNNIRKLQIIAE